MMKINIYYLFYFYKKNISGRKKGTLINPKKKSPLAANLTTRCVNVVRTLTLDKVQSDK